MEDSTDPTSVRDEETLITVSTCALAGRLFGSRSWTKKTDGYSPLSAGTLVGPTYSLSCVGGDAPEAVKSLTPINMGRQIIAKRKTAIATNIFLDMSLFLSSSNLLILAS